MSERDYSKDIIIDENDLENEWLTHPSLYLYYAEAYAEAVYEKDIKKSTLDYTYSILYDDIKTNWRDHFSSKPTEPASKEWIVRNTKYRKAEKEFIDATREANILLNVKNAFEHRKHALSNVVSLMITGFHSEPKNKAIKRKQKGGHKAQKETLSDNKDNGIRATTRKQRKRKE